MNAPFRPITKPAFVITSIKAEVERLFSELFRTQTAQQLVDAWVTDGISGDRAMNELIDCGVLPPPRFPSPPPPSSPDPNDGWEMFKAFCAEENRKEDARRGLVLA